MNVRIIETKENSFRTPIIWDCFRCSYTHLMPTVNHLIECSVNVEIEIITPNITLCFQMYNTNGLQQSTRKVIGTSIYNSEYSVKDVKDETIVCFFSKFWDDYISNEDRKIPDDGRF